MVEDETHIPKSARLAKIVSPQGKKEINIQLLQS